MLAAPVGQAVLGDRAADGDAGVVDQDVEPAEALFDLGDDGDPGVLVGDVVVQVEPADGRGDGPALVVLQVGDDDAGALAGQQLGAGAARYRSPRLSPARPCPRPDPPSLPPTAVLLSAIR
jgi:hypothetical protein